MNTFEVVPKNVRKILDTTDKFNLTSQTDWRGNTYTNAYDPLNRIIEKKDPYNKTIQKLEYNINSVQVKSYDAAHNQTSKTDPKGTTSYTYDELNRLLTVTEPGEKVTTYAYDKAGNRESETVTEGGSITITKYSYNEQNRLTGTATTLNSQAKEIESYTYDNNGNLLNKESRGIAFTEDFDDGDADGWTLYGSDCMVEDGEYSISSGSGRKLVAADKNYADLIYEADVKPIGNSNDCGILFRVTNPATGTDSYYGYYAAIKPSENTVVLGRAAYNWKRLKVVSMAIDPGIVYRMRVEAIGSNIKVYVNDMSTPKINIDDTTYTSGSIGLRTYSLHAHFDNINVIDLSGPAQNTGSYGYDELNRLVTVTTADSITIDNTYNGDGQRTAKTVNGQTTRYLHEYDKVILELDNQNNEKARNVYGTNLIKRTADGETYYYMYNGHGDVTALLDTEGDISATYYYDAFGNITETAGEAVYNPYTYAGYRYDWESGLYYLNARYYDPKIARFLSEDTYRGDLNDPLSLNLYTYCHNEPIMYTDPTGHWDEKERQEAINDKWDPADVAEMDRLTQQWNEYNAQMEGLNKDSSEYKELLRQRDKQHDLADEIRKKYTKSTNEVDAKGGDKTQDTSHTSGSKPTVGSIIYSVGEGAADVIEKGIEGVIDLIKGVGKQAIKLFQDPEEVKKDIIKAGEQIGYVIKNLKPISIEVYNQLCDKVNTELINGDANTRAHFIGEIGGELVVMIVSAKGIEKIAKIGKAAKVADKTDEAIGLAKGAGKNGTDLARQLGKEGENAAGIVNAKQRIPSLSGTAKYRVPDELLQDPKILREIKNVSNQSYTNQLKDFNLWAKQNGYQFILEVKPGAKLSGPLQEVREKGVEISSINDLMKINMKYRDLVPILLRYLSDVSDESDKEFIVRCLGVKGFVEASKPLISEFYKSKNITYKWAIGNSLSIISDVDSIPELIKIAQQKEHGIARQMIVEGLGAYKNDDIKAVLISLLSDDEVVGHAICSLSKTEDKSLIKYIEPFLTHKVKWIRNEASKAIKKLERIK